MKKTMIGSYGAWAAGLLTDPPELSFRNARFTSLSEWKSAAEKKARELIAMPGRPVVRDATVRDSYVFDDLLVEEISWQTPYGPPTSALFLKPKETSGPLPGVLAFHDHGGVKYFGHEKIADTKRPANPLVAEARLRSYGGRAWANELARRGFAVLVPDVMPFGSRRIHIADVPEAIAPGVPNDDSSTVDTIIAYNQWTAEHESIIAKSLFCAGTTWPGAFLLDDSCALEYLLSRKEVDPEKIGCAGLSGGGMRTLFLAGIEPRIRAAVCVGFMTTWRDLLLDKSHTHTWMVYVPHLPRYLDLPELFALRAPLPALVQSSREDPLFTLSEMERSASMLDEIYRKAGHSENVKTMFYPGPHKFDLQMQEDAFEWLAQHLC
ncbi:MAG TPA: prolyl oligopeptidase family serine peptidase [Spirochaetia bacterium]|nr:prolyl oligopeptidase family serine peptidase [Spirochaetia bacterium]